MQIMKIVYVNASTEMHSFRVKAFLKPLNDELNFVTLADGFRHSLQ
jgi:hypothetical protein